MATSHNIAATRLEHHHDVGSDSTAGLTVIALLLALILGFSAADQHALDAGLKGGVEDVPPVLDGRGKWAGYL